MVIVSLIRGAPQKAVVATVLASPSTAVDNLPSPSPSPSESGPVLQLDGDFPREGPGTFIYAAGEGPLLGGAGNLLRFHVAVESNIPEEIEEFTRMVDVVLGDPRSWIAGRQL